MSTVNFLTESFTMSKQIVIVTMFATTVVAAAVVSPFILVGVAIALAIALAIAVPVAMVIEITRQGVWFAPAPGPVTYPMAIPMGYPPDSDEPIRLTLESEAGEFPAWAREEVPVQREPVQPAVEASHPEPDMSTMSDDELRTRARNAGVKGVNRRWSREATIRRLLAHGITSPSTGH